ncbi:MAG: molecular chaperone TorD family protein [Archangium sp.]|nr:molecular chaperone TorD family protein [Archangium sp.]
MTAAERQRLYAFFARLWVKELDGPFLELLDGPLGRELLPRFHEDEAALLRDADQRVATFDADFVHLTVVNLTPYESFFRRDDAMLEAGAVNPVASWLNQYALEVDLAQARALAPDHLGLELEVMAVLCAKEAEALEAGNTPAVGAVRQVQREFLDEHLLTWAPLYLFAARRNARTLLYREGAEATLQYLFTDLEQVTQVPPSPRGGEGRGEGKP